ncbi:MAG: polysaccharide deacetylase family protein, partial [Acidobacteriales bacterium]|nr:polysaccharide deacetylase family protein [Terriglobales bacterium]
DPHTLRLLEVLARHQVRATFFLIGRYVRQQPEIARRIASAGQTIGNHTATHPNLFWTSHTQTTSEIRDAQSILEDTLGTRITLFRPPFGCRRPDTLRTVRDQGLTPVLWNVKCYDWRASITSERILHYAQRGIQRNARRNRGALILLHDGGHIQLGADRNATLEATRQLLTAYPQERFITL